MSASKFYDDYEKLKTVGQGAFGTATLYRRLKDGKHVVMKEIFTMNMDQAEKKAALNEVEILATLNHTNIIQYIGNFQRDESLIIIMEYANGGNLAQLINSKRDKNETFAEKSVLNILSQVLSALAYMHARRILHRDLKTANIFLNLNGVVKIGDFGISKMLNTKSQAQTVVGTPYYLSPEMCEGYDYNEKSDIWAVGCILYELATLRKPFEAPTLPVLVQKITQCIYEDIPPTYSKELNEIVRNILLKNPELRPPAQYILDVSIPRVLKKLEALNPNYNNSTRTHPMDFKERSILYKLTDGGPMQKIVPIELPHRSIIDFSVSSTHEIVITSDNCVYYCEESKSSIQKKLPVRINNLNEHKITKCCNGCDFTILLNDQGFLLSFGDGKDGCLGHGDWNYLNEPTLVNSLVNTKITQICCGDEHVAALSSDGRVFTWGSSQNGQLGQGHNQRRCKPLALYLPNFPKIRDIFCGHDATVLLTPNGQILVCGNNSHGKLGILQTEKQINLFTPLRNLKERIKFVSIGDHHTMMLAESGSVIAMGRNLEGQLGKGTTVSYNQPQKINLNMKIKTLKCGFNFTVAADNKNVLWFWGAHYLPKHEIAIYNISQDSLRSNNLVVPLIKNIPNEIELKSLPLDQDYGLFDIVKTPRSILAFYASEKNRIAGNLIYLDRIEVTANTIFLLAQTTSPPPVKQFTNGSDESNSFVASNDLSTGTPAVITNLPNTPRLNV